MKPQAAPFQLFEHWNYVIFEFYSNQVYYL